jgi:transposase
MPQLTKLQRLELVVDSKRGKSIEAIANDHKVSQTTVKRWVKRGEKTGDVNDLPGRGRKQVLDEAADNKAVDMLMSGNYSGAEDVAKALHDEGKTKGGKVPNRITLTRHAKQVAKARGETLVVTRGQQAKKLSAANMAERLAFCKSNKRRNWNNVMFTDRKKFLLKHPGVKLAKQQWGFKGQTRDAYTVTKPACVNVYAGITKFGVTKLHFVAGTTKMKTQHKNKKGEVARNVTSSEYKEVLGTTILPEAHRLFSSQGMSNCSIMHDNDPSHKKASVAALQEWNAKHNSAISILSNWPPNSPDLNPIENVWAIVQDRVNKLGCKHLGEFKAAVASTFTKLERSMLENLFSSMQDRVKKRIELQGGKTAY